MRPPWSPRVFDAFRRAGSGAAAAMLLALAALTGATTHASAASLNVAVTSSGYWTEMDDGFKTLHLVGEVVNNDPQDAAVIWVTFHINHTSGPVTHESFLTSAAGGAAILAGTSSQGTATPDRTSFNWPVLQPADFVSAGFDSVTAAPAPTPPDHNFIARPSPPQHFTFTTPPQPCNILTPDSTDLCGTVKNLNADTARDVRVLLTFTETGHPQTTVDSESNGLMNGDSSLAASGQPGDSAKFEIFQPAGAPLYDTNNIQAVAESSTTAPVAVSSVTATMGSGLQSPNGAVVNVSWPAPADNGGSAVTGYVVTQMPGNVVSHLPASSTTLTVSGLTYGTTYTFAVAAINGIGTGDSTSSNAVTPLTVPNAPTNVQATGGIASANISWTAPAFTGGTAVTSYTVTSNPESKSVTVDGHTLNATINGLAGNQNYTFSVVATNAVGSGAAATSSAVFVQPPPPPGAPSNVTATAGSGYATVNWSAAPAAAAFPVTSYTVTASPGGATVTTDGSKRSAVLGGLSDGSYAFSVVAANANGSGPAASTPGTVAVVNSGGQYHPLPPARILDTRVNNVPLGQGETRDVEIIGWGGVPNVGVAAAIINVTVTQPTASSFLTVYPSGQPTPTASNLNFTAGQTVPNLVVATLGSTGSVTIFNHTGSVHVIFDVQGWISKPENTGGVFGTSGLFRAMSPQRLMDTRSALGGATRMTSGQTVSLQVAGVGANGVPSSGASAVVLNVTAVSPSDPGYLSVLPGGAPLAQPPPTSSVNFVAGQVIPNRVVVPLSPNGQIRIYNFQGTVDVVVDVNGWYTDGSDPSAVLGQYLPMAPTRILDTRDLANNANHLGPLGPGDTVTLPVVAVGRCATGTSSAVLNVTVTDTTASSFLRVYPSDARASTSDLNWTAGTVIPNLVVVRLSQVDGTVTIYNLAGTVDVVADLTGCFN